jgi:phospholipase C
MLENRSFDTIYGNWMDQRMATGEVRPSKWDTNALQGKRLLRDYQNVVVDRSGRRTVFPVWSADKSREDPFSSKLMGIPNGDPAEKFSLLNKCVFGVEDPDEDADITLSGFAQEYYEREMHDEEDEGHTFPDRTDFVNRRSPAMHVFLPEQVEVFTALAQEFGLSDTYFSSAPCQTWPNRLFAMTGHCYGYVNNLADRGEMYDHDKMRKRETMMRLTQFTDEVIFDKLLKNGVEWSIYSGDCPLSVSLSRQLNGSDEVERCYDYTDFREHVEQGYLAPFTWVEPQYLRRGDKFPTDMHPPHNVLHAQNLVKEVYETLRSDDDLWSKTLFIVNCDEGVGVFDHVPPPKAPHPMAGENHWFWDQKPPSEMASNPFERYGTRTPCLLATPLLNRSSVVRAEDQDYPFDHTSVLRTVLDLFVSTDAYLTNRDYNAPSIAPYLLSKARPDLGPKTLYSRPPPTDDPESLRKDNKRSGCHGVKRLMQLGLGGQTDEGDEGMTQAAALLGVMQLGTDGVRTGYEHHLARRDAFKIPEGHWEKDEHEDVVEH